MKHFITGSLQGIGLSMVAWGLGIHGGYYYLFTFGVILFTLGIELGNLE